MMGSSILFIADDPAEFLSGVKETARSVRHRLRLAPVARIGLIREGGRALATLHVSTSVLDEVPLF